MIKYSVEIYNVDQLDNLLWGGARDRWDAATDDQKNLVWDYLQSILDEDGSFESLTQINDIIWFECDEIFDPE